MILMFTLGRRLDSKGTSKHNYRCDYGPTNLRTYSIWYGLQRIDGAITSRYYHTTREQGANAGSLSTTLMVTITTLIQLARTIALKRTMNP